MRIATFLLLAWSFLIAPTVFANIITVDFSDAKGPMKPLNGLLLVPNYDIPDGRVVPLQPRVFRDDSNFQAWCIFGRDHPYDHFTEYEYCRLALFKSAYQRVTSWGAKLYPIFLTSPSWVSSNNQSAAGYPKDLAIWKQWIRDNVEYAKSQHMDIPFWDSWNEVDGINLTQYLAMYSQEWSAVKEVNPKALLGGPSTYNDTVHSLTALGDQCLAQGQTVDIAAWHNLGNDPKDAQSDAQAIAKYRGQHPAAGIQQLWVEEYHSGGEALNIINLVNWLSGLTDCGVDFAIKSTWVNADSISDLLTVQNTAANNCVRNTNWWVMKAYGEMSGTRVGVTQGGGENVAIASYDKKAGEAKILISGNQGNPVSLTLNLNHQPFTFFRIDKYKVTSTENDGLVLQGTETPGASENLTTHLSIGAGEVWLVVLKDADSAPSSFMPKTPDDGLPAGTQPTLTWTPASGATTYALQVSASANMANPVVSVSGLTDTSYHVTTSLNAGQWYYWWVAAVNAHGVTVAGSRVIYSFLASADEKIPVGRFSLQMPANYEMGTPLAPVFAWTACYGATSYRLQVATDSTFNNPEIDSAGPFTQVAAAGGMVALNYTPGSKLSPATTYYARVYGVNANGSRIMNGPVHVFTTTTDGAPASFSLQSPPNGTNGLPPTGQLHWSATPGSFFYKLEVSTASDLASPILVRDYITTNSYTLDPHLLSPGTTYFWRVTGYTKDRSKSTVALGSGANFTTGQAAR